MTTRSISDLSVDEYECFKRTGRFARFAFRKSLPLIEWREHDRFTVAHDRQPQGIVELKAIQRLPVAANRIETLLQFEKVEVSQAATRPANKKKPAGPKKKAA